jgi:hypothetical protein
MLKIDFRTLYDSFDAPLADLDCGLRCAPHNPTGKPFCCDICQAVPAVYREEWEYLRRSSDLWHPWQGNECSSEVQDPAVLAAQTPEHMLLLACKGPAHCQRSFRSLSCRQFPFFPYITSADRFIGLAYDWEFEETCWVISHLDTVSQAYRDEFVRVYDQLLFTIPGEFEGYAIQSDQMRLRFAGHSRRFPLLHRNGKDYLVSPCSERMQRVGPECLPKYGVYR